MGPRVLAVAMSLLLAGIAGAQTTPPPSGPFPPPITGYAGRYFDSAQTPSFQALRAQLVKVAPERGLILMKLSRSLFGVYDLNAFASRLAGPLSTGAYGEKYLSPDVFSVNPEGPGSGWTTFGVDSQQRLFDFDYDDRGYFYLAYSIWGFGIVNGGGALQAQLLPGGVNLNAQRIVALSSGITYYALVSDASAATTVYDVTNPATPLFLQTLPFGITSYAKLASGGVAIVTTGGQLRIYGSALTAATNLPAQVVAPQPGFAYVFAASDGSTIFATQRTTPVGSPPGTSLFSVLRSSGGTYSETRTTLPNDFLPRLLNYGAGYVVLAGVLYPNATATVMVFDAATLNSFLLVGNFPSPATGVAQSLVPYSYGGQTYLIAALLDVGEVFTLSGSAASAVPAFTPAMLIALGIGMAAIAAWRIR